MADYLNVVVAPVVVVKTHRRQDRAHWTSMAIDHQEMSVMRWADRKTNCPRAERREVDRVANAALQLDQASGAGSVFRYEQNSARTARCATTRRPADR